MKMIKYCISAISLIVLLGSCETDFDTTTEWEDISVVYCLLDQMDSIQYLKINRAFLGEGNALVYAQEKDSSNYSYNLDAWIEEWTLEGDSLGKLFEFEPTTDYPKEPGIFYYPDQIIYKGGPATHDTVKYIIIPPNDTIGFIKVWLNENNIFKLKIADPVTGKQIWSKTILVQDFPITSPSSAQEFIKFTPNVSHTTEFRWELADNDPNLNPDYSGQFRYEVDATFNYREYGPTINSGDTIEKTINLLSATGYPYSGVNEITVFYSDDSFFSNCLNSIPLDNQSDEDKITVRFAGDVNVVVSAAATEYNLYMQVYEPSTSIVQERPPYTNINNGIGIFSARYKTYTAKKLHPESVNDLDESLKFPHNK